ALVVPPGEPEVTRDHVGARVHVTDHALRGRNLARELVLDRMARLVFWNVLVGCLRAPEIAGLVVERGVRGVAVVRVDHVTSGATGRAIIAWMIVGAQVVERRIQQPRLLQSKKNRIGTLRGTQPTRAQSLIGLARILVFIRQPDFEPALPT